MRDYIVLTDSGCDLDSEIRTRYGLECVNMHFMYGDKDYECDLDWKEMSAQEFYSIIRNGTRIITSQVPRSEYERFFISAIESGKDVLYIGCSSMISSGVKSAFVVRDEVLAKYPDAKIICIDTLRTSMGQGLLAISACENKANGMNIEENAKWIEDHKQTVNMEGTVENLVYLKRAGRVSAASAFFGGLMNIKPIIISDAKGQNFAVEKTRGRKASLDRLIERTVEHYEDVPHQHVFLCHADCLEEAEQFKKDFITKLGKEVPVTISWVGPGVGASVGPGMMAIFVYGKEVTVNKEEA